MNFTGLVQQEWGGGGGISLSMLTEIGYFLHSLDSTRSIRF